jgi:RNA polymerase sigma-70 factor (ECF subfamily)
MSIAQLSSAYATQPDQVDDQEIVSRVAKGDEQAFAQLVSRYSSSVFCFMKRMVSSDEDAEDLTQETFCSLHKHRSKLDSTKDIKPYIFTIARRKAISLIRWRTVRQVMTPLTMIHEQTLEVDEQSPLDEYHHKQRENEVLKALDTLSSIKRAVIVLRFFECLSYPEISQIMGKPEGTVKSIAFRAEKELRQILAGHVEVSL